MAQSYNSLPMHYANSLLGEEDVPAAFLPTKATKLAANTSCNQKAVRTSSASIGPGSSAIFQIPNGGGFLKNHSVYLTGTLVLTMNNVATTYRFAGPRQGIVAGATGAVGAGDNAGTFSASAIVNRLTCSIGSQQISQVASYNAVADILNTHATSSDYTVNDNAALSFAGVTRVTSATPNAAGSEGERTINFCIPLISGIWSGSDSYLPLWLLRSPLTIEVLTSSVSDSFVFSGAGAAITGYSINNAQVVYSEVSVSSDLKSAIRDRLNAGAMWRQNMNSLYVIQTASTQGLNFNVGLNCSSVKAVICADRQPSGGPGVIAQTGDLVLNSFSNARFFYDGRVQNNFDYNNEAITYAELQRALGSLWSADVTSSFAKATTPTGLNAPYTDLCISKWAYGVSSDCVQESSVGFTGIPCQMLNIQTFNDSVANDPDFPYVNETFLAGRNKVMLIFFDEALLVSANGECSLVR